MLRLIVGFLPWIILGTLGEQWFVLSLVFGLVTAAVTTFGQYRRGTPKNSWTPSPWRSSL